MAVHVGSTQSSRSDRKVSAAKSKARRERIILAAGGVLLVGILAIEVPSMMSKLSGNSGTPAVSAPAAAAPSGGASLQPSVAQLTSAAPVLARIQRLPAKDPFVPQLGASGAAEGASAAITPAAEGSTPTPPAVRATHLVPKDPFVPQLAAPTPATAITAAKPSSVVVTPPLDAAAPGKGYLVVLASVSALSGQAVAQRAVVAAENAGLPDVRASVLRTSTGAPLEVYTGPYPSKAVAEQELIRALRVGYSQAMVQAVPHIRPGL